MTDPMTEFLAARLDEEQDPAGSPRRSTLAQTGWYIGAVREFAAAYADHPDYRQEWKP